MGLDEHADLGTFFLRIGVGIYFFWVGVAILWNLDFNDMGNETGAFHVVGRPAFDALAGMPK